MNRIKNEKTTKIKFSLLNSREKAKAIKREKFAVVYITASFFLPVIVMLAVYALLGIYPFGAKTILTIDLNNQYISYFAYLKEMLEGNHSFFYSFSKTLGGDMIGLSAYYLMSPLNLFLLLFPASQLPSAVEIITLVKLGLCGAAFFICIFRKKNPWHGWIFSTAYALMSYHIVYQQNIMWLDGMVLLPVIITGIHRIFQKKPAFLYLGALSSAVIINYYIGFMLCIFSVLYFLYYFFCADNRERFWDLGVIGSYALASVLAGGLSAWLLLPVFKTFSGGKAVFSLSALSMEPDFHWSDFGVKFFPGSFDYEQVVMGLPNVFCGITVLFFLGLFFLHPKISFRKKAGVLGMFLILYGSFYYNGLNLVWHGFNPPAWFPYRYSFVFSFLMVLCGEEGFQRAEELSLKRLSVLSAFILAALISAAFYFSRKPFSFMSKEKYLAAVLILAADAFFYLSYACKKPAVAAAFGRPAGRPYRLMPGMILLVCMLELCMNGVYVLKHFKYADYPSWQKFVETTKPAVEYIKQKDDGFYRMEKTYHRKQCDPMLFDFRGLSHYSSTEKNMVKYFMGQMGFRNNGNWSYYNRGSTYAADSLLSVKYILSQKALEAPYQKIDRVNGISIYRNPYALPIGFMADDAVLSFNLDNPHKFEIQNDLWASLCPGAQPVFQKNPSEQTASKNLEQADGFCYLKKNAGEQAFLEYAVTAKSRGPLFGYFGTNDMHQVSVKVNGKSLGKYFDAFQYDIIRLGSFEKGEKITVRLVLKESMASITDAWFYTQDMEVFSKYCRALSQEALETEKFSDTEFLGTVSNQSGRNYMLFTIPYEDGWKAYVDDREAESCVGLGIFLTVKIPAGTHKVELQYIPQGYQTGLLLTGASLVCLGFWISYRRYRRSQNQQGAAGDGSGRTSGGI